MENNSPHMTMIRRLQTLATEYDSRFESPTGHDCRICSGGIYIPATKSAIPWGDVRYTDLLNILRDNETHIDKLPLISGKEAGVPWRRFRPKSIDQAIKETFWEEIPPNAVPQEPPEGFNPDEVPF